MRHTKGWICGVVAAGVLAIAPVAGAHWRRMHATRCWWNAGTSGLYDWVGSGGSYYPNPDEGLTQTNTTGPKLYVTCPVEDDDVDPKQNLSSADVYGADPRNAGASTGDTQVQFCVTYYWSQTGAQCSALKTSSVDAQGNFDVHLATSDLSGSGWDSTHVADFGYVYIAMPWCKVSGGLCVQAGSVRGIYLSM